MSVFNVRATGTLQEIDAAEVRRAASILFDPKHKVQIQALPSGKCRLANAADLDDVLRAAREHSDEAGVYWTLNPCEEATGDGGGVVIKDMLHRRWLLFDADPIKNKDDNSTAEEQNQARELGNIVFDALAGRGFPEPISINSGNGWHLLYRIDLPNNDLARSVLRDVLNVVGDAFDNEHAKIDRKVYNANRISKLPGTWARKGPHSKERPHRMAAFHHVPEKIEVVPFELLQSLAAERKKKERTTPVFQPRLDNRPLFLMQAGHEGGRAYCMAALKYAAHRVRDAAFRTRNNTLNDETISIAGLPPQFITDQEIQSEMILACHTNGLMETEAEKSLDTIKRAIRDGRAKPLDIEALRKFMPNGIHKAETKVHPGKEEKPSDKRPNWTVEIDNTVTEDGDPGEWLGDSRELWSADEFNRVIVMKTAAQIMVEEFPEPNWVVAGMLSEGLNMMVGKPKLGKSMLALNLGLTIAAGGKALGNIQTVPGDVLYLALEDKYRRIKARMCKMLKGLNAEAGRRLVIVPSWPKQNDGGMDMIHYWATKIAKNPVLVIIDVLQHFREPQPNKGSAFAADYAVMSGIKKLVDADKFHCLAIHHTRKGESDDPMEDTSGTNAINAACDGVLTLKRSRGENDATLIVDGRDISRKELAIRFDDETLTWKHMGDAKEQTASELKKKIIDSLKSSPNAQYWPSELAEMLKGEKGTVKQYLWRMANDGLLKRTGGKYSWPGSDYSAATASESEEF